MPVAEMQSRPHRVTEAGPVHDEREIEAVLEVLRGGGLEDLGPRVAEFERRGAALLAKDFGVMVNSGTSALVAGGRPPRLRAGRRGHHVAAHLLQ